MRLNYSVVNQANEGSNVLVVHACEAKDLVLQVLLLLLQHDGLLLLGLAFLGVLQVLLFAEGAALFDVVDQDSQAILNIVLNLLFVEALHMLVVAPLVRDELVDWDLLLFWNLEGGLALHLEEESVDLHVLWQEVWSGEDELLGEILARPLVHSVAHISFPETEHLADQVMLEELHTRKHVVHGGLLHPLRERQELGRVDVCFLAPTLRLVAEDLHNALSADREVLIVQLLVVVDRDQVIGTEFRWQDLSAVAVQELDGHVVAVLGEEGNGLLSGLDALLQMPDGSAFPDEVLLTELADLILTFLLLVLDEGGELLVFKVIFSLAVVGLYIVGLSFYIVHFFAVTIHALHVHLALPYDRIALHVVLNALLA